MSKFKVGDEVVNLLGEFDKHRFGWNPSMPDKPGAVGVVTEVDALGEQAVRVRCGPDQLAWLYLPSEIVNLSDYKRRAEVSLYEESRAKGSLYESVTVYGDEIQTQVSLQNENASLSQQLRELEKEERVLRDRLLDLEEKIQRKRDYHATNERKLQAWDTLIDKGA